MSCFTIICSQEEFFRRRLTSCHDNNSLQEIGILNYPTETEKKKPETTGDDIRKTLLT